jgi:predicted ATPase
VSRTHTFSGRSEELQLLSRCLHLSEEGEPQFVMLEGPSGVGKTALLRQFSRRAAEREKPGWVITVTPPSEGSFDPLAQAAREANLRHRLVAGRGTLATANELLPAWLAAVPGVGNLIAAVVATTRATRDTRIQRRTPGAQPLGDSCRSLIAEAARHPLVLLCDDLHRASPAAIDQLEQLIRGCDRGVHLLLIGAFEATPVGVADPPIQRLLTALPTGKVQQRTLRELNELELEILLGRRFPGVALPDSYARELIERTGGQPRAVLEYLDRMLHSGAIRFEDGRWELSPRREDDGDCPEDVLLSADLTSIPVSTIETLRAASTVGDEFDGSSVARLMHRDELYVEDQLATALHLGLIRVIGEISDEENEISTVYRFRSSHLRATLARLPIQRF